MPYKEDHYLLTVKGTRASQSATDEWQFGLRISESTAFTPANFEDALTDARGDVETWWGAIRQLYGAATKVTSCKFARIGTDGLYEPQDRVSEQDITVALQPGTSASPNLPGQIATVITLLTNTTRGLASKGRIFLPALSTASVNTDGSIFGPHVETIADATVTLLNNLNNWPGGDTGQQFGRVIVASKVGAGEERDVTGIRVGRRFDVQRRRAEKFPENPSERLDSVS